jgi:16S rRNA C967 or C1407 C5-methylase (RsmB/RsmF family)
VVLVRHSAKRLTTFDWAWSQVAPDENERMIAAILKEHPCMRLVESAPRVGDFGLANCGLDGIAPGQAGQPLRMFVQRFDPGHSVGGDSIGFFLAKLMKVTDDAGA